MNDERGQLAKSSVGVTNGSFGGRGVKCRPHFTSVIKGPFKRSKSVDDLAVNEAPTLACRI